MQTKILLKKQLAEVIDNREFGKDVLHSQNRVAVIMTQDWCPEWKSMKKWIYSLEDRRELDIYEFIYNKSEYFNDFLQLKEQTWKNSLIPYVRYYLNGVLIHESNFVTKEKFLKMFNLQ